MLQTERSLHLPFHVLARCPKTSDKACHLRIPDTLYYQHGSLRLWYTTEETEEVKKEASGDGAKNDKRECGEVMKRDKRDCTKEKILQVFCTDPITQKPIEDGLPVAIYMHYSNDTQEGSHHGKSDRSGASSSAAFGGGDGANKGLYAFSGESEPLSVDFFDKNLLANFLGTRDNKDNTIVQQWVYGSGQHASIVQVVWSPHKTLPMVRQNYNNIQDVQLSLRDRCSTDETCPFTREVKATPRMLSTMKESCQTLVEHWSAVEQRQILRMVAFFSFDQKQRPVFLWASEIQLTTANMTVTEVMKRSQTNSKRNLVQLSPVIARSDVLFNQAALAATDSGASTAGKKKGVQLSLKVALQKSSGTQVASTLTTLKETTSVNDLLNILDETFAVSKASQNAVKAREQSTTLARQSHVASMQRLSELAKHRQTPFSTSTPKLDAYNREWESSRLSGTPIPVPSSFLHEGIHAEKRPRSTLIIRGRPQSAMGRFAPSEARSPPRPASSFGGTVKGQMQPSAVVGSVAATSATTKKRVSPEQQPLSHEVPESHQEMPKKKPASAKFHRLPYTTALASYIPSFERITADYYRAGQEVLLAAADFLSDFLEQCDIRSGIGKSGEGLTHSVTLDTPLPPGIVAEILRSLGPGFDISAVQSNAEVVATHSDAALQHQNGGLAVASPPLPSSLRMTVHGPPQMFEARMMRLKSVEKAIRIRRAHLLLGLLERMKEWLENLLPESARTAKETSNPLFSFDATHSQTKGASWLFSKWHHEQQIAARPSVGSTASSHRPSSTTPPGTATTQPPNQLSWATFFANRLPFLDATHVDSPWYLEDADPFKATTASIAASDSIVWESLKDIEVELHLLFLALEREILVLRTDLAQIGAGGSTTTTGATSSHAATFGVSDVFVVPNWFR